MQYEVENIYTSCSCNSNPNTLAWGDNDLVYYGSCNSICVYDPQESQRILHTYCSHLDEVRCVRWLKDCGGSSSPLLVSSSSDATAVVWKITNNKGLCEQAVLKGHAGAVTTADGLQLQTDSGQTEIIIATTSVDFNVKIWKTKTADSKEFECVQTLRAGPGFCLDVKLHTLPGTNIPLLACAMDDFKIGLFVWEQAGFQKKEVLIGHEDWVCCVDWTTLDDGDLLLASGSQDSYIRLWRLCPTDPSLTPRPVSQLSPSEEIRPEEKVLQAGGHSFALKLESVLLGHSTWVHSIAWHPRVPHPDNPTASFQPLKLLSSSMDASVCVWEPDEVSGVWTPTARLGLVKESSLGVRGCVWGPASSILAHSIRGSLHRWDLGDEGWKNGFTVGGGHYAEVMDLCWEPEGAFLISVSMDQTTRVHAPWSQEGRKEVWHELARPQVHGYDLTCIAPISRYRFASGAEEKIIRSFQAPKQFKSCLKHICKVDLPDDDMAGADDPQAASLPVLGLSNLSVTDVSSDEMALLLHGLENCSEPLREEVLWRSTLWPEERKLYGHGYELYCLATSSSGHLLASACRAALPEHAAIVLWDTRTWQEVQKLPSHQLTVTQLAFSPDDQFLLSVSRDRRLSLFQRAPETAEGGPQFSLVFSTDKKTGIHTRIIWACSWSPDSLYFGTGSREGTVVVWGRDLQGQCSPQGPPLALAKSVTALAFAPSTKPYLLAVGGEDGLIALYEWRPQGEKEGGWSLQTQLDKETAHHKTVRRLAFRPGKGRGLQLASCGADHAVKIFTITQR